jgi:DNA repair exonuclease SbcCD ATPase subunit
MSDIVEHLRREASKQDILTCEDMLQAADEIENLHHDLKSYMDAANGYLNEIDTLKARQDRTALAWTQLTDSQEQEIEELKAEIERLRAALVAILDFEQDVYVKDKEVILYMKNTAKQGLGK